MITDMEYITITQEMIDYFKEKKQLENAILENGEKTVQDLKVFSVANGLTLLYIKCEENELRPPSKNSHKKASKNEMKRSISLIY